MIPDLAGNREIGNPDLAGIGRIHPDSDAGASARGISGSGTVTLAERPVPPTHRTMLANNRDRPRPGTVPRPDRDHVTVTRSIIIPSISSWMLDVTVTFNGNEKNHW